MRLEELNELNWEFDFDDEHAGLLELKTIPPAERLILDFYEEAHVCWLELEFHGSRWASVGQDLKQRLSVRS